MSNKSREFELIQLPLSAEGASAGLAGRAKQMHPPAQADPVHALSAGLGFFCLAHIYIIILVNIDHIYVSGFKMAIF